MSSKGRGRGTKNTSSQNVQVPARPRNLHRYKTELCRAWGENRQCKYGDKCQVSTYTTFSFYAPFPSPPKLLCLTVAVRR